MIHLIYASAAASEFTDEQVASLVQEARNNNARDGITGMLLFAESSFFQVLEGDPESVDTVFARIMRDPRHAKPVVIIREPIARRVFEDWTMGYASMTRSEVLSVVGLNDFFDRRTCFAGLSGGRARKLLEAFAAGRWRVKLEAARGDGAGVETRSG